MMKQLRLETSKPQYPPRCFYPTAMDAPRQDFTSFHSDQYFSGVNMTIGASFGEAQSS